MGSAPPLDVTNQMIGIMVRRGTRESRAQLGESDVLVEPDLGRMTAVDFSKVPQVMEVGATALDAVRPRLAALSLTPDAYAAYHASRRAERYPDEVLAFVRAGSRSEADAARIEAVFGGLADAPLDVPVLQRKLGRQYGLDRYESLDYRLVRDDGALGLEIDARRKSWGPNFLRVGVSVEQDFDGGATANAGARVLMTGLNRYDAEWLTDVQLGEEPRFFTEFFQPLSLTSDVFFAPSLRYELQTLQVVADGHRVARYRSRESEAALAIGAELSNWGEVRAGFSRGDGSAQVMIGDPGPAAARVRPRRGIPQVRLRPARQRVLPEAGTGLQPRLAGRARVVRLERGRGHRGGGVADGALAQALQRGVRDGVGARRSTIAWSRRSSSSRWAGS